MTSTQSDVTSVEVTSSSQCVVVVTDTSGTDECVLYSDEEAHFDIRSLASSLATEATLPTFTPPLA